MEGLKKWIALLATVTMLLLALMSGLISAAPSKEWKEDKEEQSDIVEDKTDEEGLGGEDTVAGPSEEKNTVDAGEAPEAPDSGKDVADTGAGGSEELPPAALLAACEPTMSTMASVTPTLVDPWASGDAKPECVLAATILGVSPADEAYKVDAAAPNGTYTSNGNTITISNSTGKVFDWASVYPVQCVIVKAGTAAYLFYYPGGAYGDTGLYAPYNKDISHVTFCFNVPVLGSICGTKWEDHKEGAPVDGVTIILLDATGNEVARTVTANGGKYCFNDIPLGEYTVRELLDPGWYAKSPASGEWTVILSESGSGIVTAGILCCPPPPPPPPCVTDVDFINARYGSITGLKFEDMNADADKDAEDTPWAGITIQLKQGATVVATTVTDANGRFTFSSVMPGTYDVVEVLGAGIYTSTSLIISGVEVASGQAVVLDETPFLNYEEGSISGYKYRDLDADGELDPGEPGFAGVTIKLYDADDDLIDTTVTDANGKFVFIGVVPGTYSIAEVLGAGVLSKRLTTITGVVVVSGEETVLEQKYFLNYEEGSITGLKFEDMNADGDKDAGDAPWAGITIQLKQGATVVATTVTDANGRFLFTGVEPGTYDVVEVLGAGIYTSTSLIISGVEVASGQAVVLDETPFLNYEEGSISGYKYRDLDADGELDEADTPWDGNSTPIAVELWSGGSKIEETIINNEHGFYLFADLEPGEYTVKEAEPFPEGVETAMDDTSFTVVIESGEHLVVAPEQYFLNYILEVAPVIIEPEVAPQVPGQLPMTGWNLLPWVLAAGLLALLGLITLMLGVIQLRRN
ncbi:MAG: SdrD B-like domain-containing protein [Actinomycetota bacterium]|nr:SdrD B-like domain-containing protein [Actinomycetota bacterium]